VSNRTYLSIGDVLSLLRQEFPDVTISKIRFLESQGLVNPERSPSGYRKFYDHDVERLRWVLRQQREHFLPLKVIRDRLAETDGVPSDDVADAPVEGVVAAAEDAAAHDAASANGSGALDGAPTDDEPREVEPAMAGAHRAAPAATAPHLAPRPPPAPAPSPRAEPVVAPPVVAPPVTSAEPPRPTSAAPTPAAVAARAAVAPVVGRRAEPEAPKEPPVRHVPPERPVAREVSATSETDGAAAGAAPPGASLTVDELCNASGLSVTEVAALEGFGLVEAITVAGTLYYDEECLTVAKLVSDFARYGIEPRHLRLYRNAVDRELGLVEQIITPLLRQRNPEARQRAVDAAADLNRLGQQLRGALLRKGVRNQFGS
jgi:DNA-binding transcriptional MerR regulator